MVELHGLVQDILALKYWVCTIVSMKRSLGVRPTDRSGTLYVGAMTYL